MIINKDTLKQLKDLSMRPFSGLERESDVYPPRTRENQNQ